MNPTSPPTPAPRARPDLAMVWVGGVAFVFDPVACRLHELNGTAAEVLGLLDGTRSHQEVVALLAERYGVTNDVVADDVADLVASLDGQRLLEGATPVDAPRPLVDLTPQARSRPTAAVLGRLLARRQWSWSLGPFAALDLTFTVHGDGPGMADDLGACLRSLVAGPDGPAIAVARRAYYVRSPRSDGARWRLFLDDRLLHTATTAGRVIDHLLWSVNRVAVDATQATTVLHAAGAVWNGLGVLLPARSNAGKSTLITALVDAGFGYLSDEAVGLDDRDRLVPFPKAISLDRGSWGLFPQLNPVEPDQSMPNRWHLDPETVRAGSVSGPVPLQLIVVPEYEAGAAPRLEPLPASAAFPVVMEQVFHLGSAPGALEQIAALVQARPCFRLVSGDLAGSVEAVRRLAETEMREGPSPSEPAGRR